jgi:serine/threonine protein kinase
MAIENHTTRVSTRDKDTERRVGTHFGELEILARIGDGGMGAVYVGRLVHGSVIERLYAMKIPHRWLLESIEGSASMLLDEARIASGIRHPNVIPVLGVPMSDQGEMALLMDYVEGCAFDFITKQARSLGVRLPVSVLLRILLDGLTGLSAAHTQETIDGRPMQIVHRDIAPNNLLVGIDGQTRLTDFGIARAVERYSHSQVGSVKGRMSYMAPERITSNIADARSDVFSYGVMLWETLAGRPLFRVSNEYQTARRILDLVIPPLAGIDEELAVFDPIIECALARKPDDRFDTADEMLEALECTALETTGIATSRMVQRAIAPLHRTRIEAQRRRIREAACRSSNRDYGLLSEAAILLEDPTMVDGWQTSHVPM